MSKRKFPSDDVDHSPRSQPPRKRLSPDSSSLPIARVLSSAASAYPLASPTTTASSSSSREDDDDEDDLKPSISDVKVKVEGAVVDPSRLASGASKTGGDDAGGAVEAEPFHSALTALFDAFLRVLDQGTVDSRILFIHEFLTQLLQVL